MSAIDIEETTKAYENDYAYAPVGLFVLPLWLGSFLLGLFAFFLNFAVAKGLSPFAPYIVGGQRSFFQSDETGVKVAAFVMLLLVVLSLALAVVGRLMTLKKQNLDGLWKLAKFGIPGLVLVVAAVAAFLNR